MNVNRLPEGFLAAGRNVGIKSTKRDFGVLISESPATFAAVVTRNKSRAACVDRTALLREQGAAIRAIVAISGNANALTGAQGVEDDDAMARRVASELGVEPQAVVTAATGVIGHRVPIDRILSGVGPTLRGLSRDPAEFAESIMTTDRTAKMFTRDVFVSGTRIRLHAVAKGAGMISPALATTLCFVTTDAEVGSGALQSALSEAVDATFNQLTVDNDMSTNDVVVALANGWAENERIELGSPSYDVLLAGMNLLLDDVARAIARDGEGATRLLEVTVGGAYDVEDARKISRAIAGSMLVKSAIFGADPYALGRIVSAAGACAASTDAHFDLAALSVVMQGTRLFERGLRLEIDMQQLRHRMTEPEVKIELDLGQGDRSASAYGCDLSYDYVKINADYAAATVPTPEGSVAVNDRLAELGPTIKKRLLIEALRYIERFRGIRAVIKVGGQAMVDPRLEGEFAEDVLLLRSVGLLPIVVHGGGKEISATLDRLGIKTEFVDGLRVTDPSSIGVVEMVLSGSVNQRIVANLNRKGSRAVGLSGKDGGLIRAKKLSRDRDGNRDLGLVGQIVSVNVALIDMLERDGYIPIISPIGLGDGGVAYNINADTVAAEVAAGLRADKLIFMSDVVGLVDGEQVVSELSGDQLKMRIDRGDVTGGMRHKLEACLRALKGDVSSVHLVDGRVPHNLIAELFTDRGVGTLIRQA